MNLLLVHPKVAWAYVTSAGTVKGMGGGRPFRIGFPGLSDIIGQMCDGRLLAIEVKVPGKKPTVDQIVFIDGVFWDTVRHAVLGQSSCPSKQTEPAQYDAYQNGTSHALAGSYTFVQSRLIKSPFCFTCSSI